MSRLKNLMVNPKKLAANQQGYTVLELLAVIIIAVILIVLIVWR